MAPIKFEENLKEKIEERTIQPSEASWDVLAKRLDNQDKRKPKTVYFWVGIAASIVGVALVTTLFFNNSEFENSTPAIVDTETKEEQVKEDIINPVENKKEINTVAVEQVEDIKKSTKKTISTPKNGAVVQKSTRIVSPNTTVTIKEAVAATTTKEQEKVKHLETPLNSLEFEKAKINDVVDEIKKLNLEDVTVSNAEIDSLLKQAEREILKNRLYNETTRTVSADALLQDVEDELEQSFRAKVFDALKNSFDTVKTAVAERNH